MKLRLITILAGGSLILSSCLKEEGYLDTLNDKGQIVAEMTEASLGGEDNSVALEPNPPTETFAAFHLRLGSKAPTNQSYKIKIEVDNSLVSDYNSNHGTSLVVPTSAQISIPSLEVTIPAGTTEVEFPVTVNKAALDFANTYGMGFKIAEANGTVINDIARKIVLVLGVKNKYDGVYEFRGRVEVQPDRPSTFSAAPFTYPADILMITSGPTSVKMVNTAFGTSGFHPLITTGISGFGGTQPRFDFNSSDQMTAVTNLAYVAPPAGNGRQFIMNPLITDSRYVPASKTIYGAIVLTQPGFANMPLWDTLVYTGPR